MWRAITLLIITFVCFSVGYSILWILGLVSLKKKKKDINPYIEYHKGRMANDKAYDNYLKWLDKNNHSLPVDKVLTKEEKAFKREYEKTAR